MAKKKASDITVSYWYETPLEFMYCTSIEQLKSEVIARRASNQPVGQIQKRTVIQTRGANFRTITENIKV